MAQGRPQPGEFYRHFKGRLYQVITVAVHSETGEKLVIYQALYGSYGVYARPYDMFISEVDHWKYPDVQQKYRFQLIENTDSLQQTDPVNTDTKQTGSEAGRQNAPVETETVSKQDRLVREHHLDAADNLEEEVLRAAARSKEQLPESEEGIGDPVTSEIKPAESDEEHLPAKGEEKETAGEADMQEAADPWLIRYMDARNDEERFEILGDMRPHITDKLIDELAVVSDLAIPEGRLMDRYAELKNCLRMRIRYEGSRMR